jgi:tape measure domain-containing protein
MSNVLNYVLNVNGNVLSMLNRIGAASGSSRNDVRGLRNEVEGLNTVNLSGLTSKITGVFATLGIGAILGKTIKDGMEQEMRNVSFEVLFGGVDNAKQMIDQVSDYAAKSPYGKVGLSEATQMMAGFGIAQEKIMPNMKMIGDIAMGDAQKFQSLALVLSQVSSLGYMQGNDKLQFINAGFNPLKELEKMTGKSVGQLETMMSKGQISIGMIEDALKHATSEGGQFYGMIDKINGTASGQWATAMDNISEKMLNLYDNVLQPLILPALQKFNVFLDDPIGTLGRLTDKFTTDFPIISGLIIGVTTALTAYKVVTGIITIATGLWTAAQWLLNAALTANPVGLIIAGVVALIALIAFLIIKIDGWGDTWDNVIKLCTLVFDSFKANLQLKWLQVQDFFMKGLETIEKGWYKLQSLWNEDAANAGLAKLESQRNERAKEIAEVKGKIDDINNQISNLDVIQLKVNDTSFSDVANSLKSKLGISSPGIPGTDMTPGGGTGGSGGIGGGTGGKAGKDTANGIATGGSKTTHIYVTVGEMGNNMKIYVNDLKEGAENIRDIVLDQLTRALTMAQGQI